MLTRLYFLPGWLVAVATLSAAQPTPPNIVLILVDDLGYGELGCYGQTVMQTPRLDRLAAEGMRFTQFYAGQSVCAPSRSVLMTGQHTGHTTVRGNSRENLAAQSLRDDDVTVPKMLRASGYATGLVGKWGLGHEHEPGAPRRQGFDTYFGFLNQTHAHNHFPSLLWRDGEKVPLPNDLVPVGPLEGVGYATKRVAYADDLFATEARAFIERHRTTPFFLLLSLIAPHANNERMRELGDGHDVPDFGAYAERPWTDSQKGHAAMVTRMDRHVGDVLDQLARLDLDERTLVLFTSDNGPHREGGPAYEPEFFAASGPWRGIKRDLTEGGIRVPLLVRWPGRIRAGTESAHVGYFGDVMATLAAVADVSLPPDRDSISFLPTLLGEGEQPAHEFLYWESYENGVSQAVLLHGRWKGIRGTEAGAPVQLFDLPADIGETTDVAAAHPAIVARITQIMRTAHVDNEHWKFPAR